MDPPTAYALSSLFVLLGKELIRAGRGRTAFFVGWGFTLFFGLTVQLFLFRWTGWMYSYFFPEDAFSLWWVSPTFFLAVAAAGALGAYVTGRLIRSGRTTLAVGNMLLGFAAWFILWGVTWEPYFHVGTYVEYHTGLAPHSTAVPNFQEATLWTGASYVLVGVPLAIWLVATGRRARRAAAVQPDAMDGTWRRQEMRTPQPPSGQQVVRDGWIHGVCPLDERPLSPVAATPLDDIPSIVEKAREAQRVWARTPLDERRDRLRQVSRRFLAQAEELATLVLEENGRPKAESYLAEIVPTADLFDYWIANAPTLLQGQPIAIDPLVYPGKRGVVERVPRGVVGAITPWNFPVALPLRVLVPALLSGNAVILKPSEHAARAGAFVGRLFEGLLPDGVVQVVQGDGTAGARLIEAGLDHLTFTGSRQAGRAVARACAEASTPTSLELGAKDAAIVLEDADLPRAAAGIVWGAFGNAGQNCAAIERCFVAASVQEAFVKHVEEEVAKLRVGVGEEGEVDIGPLTTPAQREIVVSQLKEIEKSHTQRIQRDTEARGLFMDPMVLVDPPMDVALSRDETFGPLLPIFTIRDQDEAVALTNGSPYGLTVSIWSKDLQRAEELGRRVHAGIVTVNNHAFTGSLAEAPWGGVRGSGFGVTNSPEMIQGLTRPRLVVVDTGRTRRELWWYPYDAALLRLARGMVRLRSGEKGKVSALQDVVVGFLQRRKGAK